MEAIVVGRKGRSRQPLDPIRGRRFDLEDAATRIRRGFEAFQAPVMGREELTTQPGHKFFAILGCGFTEVKQVANLPPLLGSCATSPLELQITAGRNVQLFGQMRHDLAWDIMTRIREASLQEKAFQQDREPEPIMRGTGFADQLHFLGQQRKMVNQFIQFPMALHGASLICLKSGYGGDNLPYKGDYNQSCRSTPATGARV